AAVEEGDRARELLARRRTRRRPRARGRERRRGAPPLERVSPHEGRTPRVVLHPVHGAVPSRGDVQRRGARTREDAGRRARVGERAAQGGAAMSVRDPNVVNPKARKRVAIVIGNPAVSTTTGWPVGFWWSELTHPYFAMTETGYEVEIFSPNGGK